MEETRIAALQRMPIFGAIRADILASLLATSRVVRVPRDGYYFRERDRAESMFVLEQGQVAIVRHWEGKPYFLGYLHEGDCFGEMAVLDLFPRSASILALEDCAAIELSTASLLKLAETDLEQFALVQMNIGRELSRRLRDAGERLFRTQVGAPPPERAPAVWT